MNCNFLVKEQKRNILGRTKNQSYQEKDNLDFLINSINMTPSSLDIDLAAVQRQEDMYKLSGSELTKDGGLAEHL